MYGIYWASNDDLDNEQNSAVRDMPAESSFLVRGPAGAGKTNILILRAKWLLVKKLSELRIIAFTKDLRDFIRIGCDQYGVPVENVTTSVRFFRDILDEHNVIYHLTNDFEVDRTMLAGKLQSLLEDKNIAGQFDALLVDESQDYSDTELLIFRKLADRLILASDSRQSIYRTTHTTGLLEKLVAGNVVTLKYHYRSGHSLCVVADAILRDSENFVPLHGQCRYDEAAKPSSVLPVKCSSFEDQISSILDKLPGQLDLYDGELIGVLFPKREQVKQFAQELLSSTKIADKTRIRVETMHSAKGLEFRSVHIAGCEALYRMGATQKRLAYTSILRGRTSVYVYYTDKIPGYLDSALAKLAPPVPDPSADDLFKR